MIGSLLRIATAAAAMGALAACGHSELRAPCSATDAYASLSAYADPCGPMRRVNEDPDLPPEFRRLEDKAAQSRPALAF